MTHQIKISEESEAFFIKSVCASLLSASAFICKTKSAMFARASLFLLHVSVFVLSPQCSHNYFVASKYNLTATNTHSIIK